MSASFDPYQEWLGIPPDQRPITHYSLLGLSLSDASLALIELEASRRIEIVRAQLKGDHGRIARRLLIELESAKVCLVDAELKAEYDTQLRVTTQGCKPKSEIANMYGNDDELTLAPIEEDETRSRRAARRATQPEVRSDVAQDDFKIVPLPPEANFKSPTTSRSISNTDDLLDRLLREVPMASRDSCSTLLVSHGGQSEAWSDSFGIKLAVAGVVIVCGFFLAALTLKLWPKGEAETLGDNAETLAENSSTRAEPLSSSSPRGGNDEKGVRNPSPASSIPAPKRPESKSTIPTRMPPVSLPGTQETSLPVSPLNKPNTQEPSSPGSPASPPQIAVDLPRSVDLPTRQVGKNEPVIFGTISGARAAEVSCKILCGFDTKRGRLLTKPMATKPGTEGRVWQIVFTSSAATSSESLLDKSQEVSVAIVDWDGKLVSFKWDDAVTNSMIKQVQSSMLRFVIATIDKTVGLQTHHKLEPVTLDLGKASTIVSIMDAASVADKGSLYLYVTRSSGLPTEGRFEPLDMRARIGRDLRIVLAEKPIRVEASVKLVDSSNFSVRIAPEMIDIDGKTKVPFTVERLEGMEKLMPREFAQASSTLASLKTREQALLNQISDVSSLSTNNAFDNQAKQVALHGLQTDLGRNRETQRVVSKKIESMEKLGGIFPQLKSLSNKIHNNVTIWLTLAVDCEGSELILASSEDLP
jgi:hypothetical protein